jgi:hemoglobin
MTNILRTHGESEDSTSDVKAVRAAASTSEGQDSSMSRSLFDQYGGFGQVSRVVSGLYDKILDSPEVSPYFEDADMRRLIDHQTRFIATLLGGPASYTNEHLERVHKHMGITEDAFIEVVELLRETLEDFGFADSDIDIVEDEFMSRRAYIVSKG